MALKMVPQEVKLSWFPHNCLQSYKETRLTICGSHARSQAVTLLPGMFHSSCSKGGIGPYSILDVSYQLHTVQANIPTSLRLGLSLGVVLRVKEKGDVGHEGSLHFSHVKFWDLIGLKLFVVTEFCQVSYRDSQKLRAEHTSLGWPICFLIVSRTSWK